MRQTASPLRRFRCRVGLSASAVALALFGGLGCDLPFAPSGQSQMWVLTTVAGRPAPTVNLLELVGAGEATTGGYAYLLTDTLVFFRGGRGEFRSTYRWSAGDVSGNVDHRGSATRGFYYVDRGLERHLAFDPCPASCFVSNETLTRARWGALRSSGYGNGEWHYEPLREAAP